MTARSCQIAWEKLGDYECKVAAPGNIGTVPGCESAVETAIEAFGGLDILVNCAGVDAGKRHARKRNKNAQGNQTR